MKKADERKIMKAAIAKYGEDDQLRIAQEECAELIQSISKLRRAYAIKNNKARHDSDRMIKKAKASIIEEVVDVGIMLDQIKEMIPGNYDEVREFKLERLNGRVG